MKAALKDHLPRLLRFVVVGGSFSLGYALLTAALISFGDTPPLPTSVIVYLICIPLAYLAQRQFAFGGATGGRYGPIIYAATQIVSLAVVSTLANRFVTASFWLNTGLYLVIAGLAAVASYLICRFVIFRSPPATDA